MKYLEIIHSRGHDPGTLIHYSIPQFLEIKSLHL